MRVDNFEYIHSVINVTTRDPMEHFWRRWCHPTNYEKFDLNQLSSRRMISSSASNNIFGTRNLTLRVNCWTVRSLRRNSTYFRALVRIVRDGMWSTKIRPILVADSSEVRVPGVVSRWARSWIPSVVPRMMNCSWFDISSKKWTRKVLAEWTKLRPSNTWCRTHKYWRRLMWSPPTSIN